MSINKSVRFNDSDLLIIEKVRGVLTKKLPGTEWSDSQIIRYCLRFVSNVETGS